MSHRPTHRIPEIAFYNIIFSSPSENTGLHNIYRSTRYTVVKVQNLRWGNGIFRFGPPTRGRVPFHSIVTIWGGGTLLPRNWRWGNGVPLSSITL